MSKTGVCKSEGSETLRKQSHLNRIPTPASTVCCRCAEGAGAVSRGLRKVMLEPNPEELVAVAKCGEGRGIQTKEAVVWHMDRQALETSGC